MPLHALTQTPVGRAPDDPLVRDEVAVATETLVSWADDAPAPDSVVAIVSK